MVPPTMTLLEPHWSQTTYDADSLCGASLRSRDLWTLLYVLDNAGVALCWLFHGMHLSHFRQNSNKITWEFSKQTLRLTSIHASRMLP